MTNPWKGTESVRACGSNRVEQRYSKTKRTTQAERGESDRGDRGRTTERGRPLENRGRGGGAVRPGGERERDRVGERAERRDGARPASHLHTTSSVPGNCTHSCSCTAAVARSCAHARLRARPSLAIISRRCALDDAAPLWIPKAWSRVSVSPSTVVDRVEEQRQ